MWVSFKVFTRSWAHRLCCQQIYGESTVEIDTSRPTASLLRWIIDIAGDWNSKGSICKLHVHVYLGCDVSSIPEWAGRRLRRLTSCSPDRVQIGRSPKLRALVRDRLCAGRAAYLKACAVIPVKACVAGNPNLNHDIIFEKL